MFLIFSLLVGPGESSPSAELPTSAGDTTDGRGNRPSLAVSLFLGYGISQFEEQADWGGTSGFVPVGFQCLVNVSHRVSAGVELHHSAVPFSWDVKPGSVKMAEWSVSQTAISAVVKYRNPRRGKRPYGKLGFGLYLSTGRSTFEEGWGRDYSLAYRPGFGAHGGLGLTGDSGRNGFWTVEAVYHVSYRRLDEDGATHRWHNCLALHIGAGLKI